MFKRALKVFPAKFSEAIALRARKSGVRTKNVSVVSSIFVLQDLVLVQRKCEGLVMLASNGGAQTV